jgi:hypothetical protein
MTRSLDCSAWVAKNLTSTSGSSLSSTRHGRIVFSTTCIVHETSQSVVPLPHAQERVLHFFFFFFLDKSILLMRNFMNTLGPMEYEITQIQSSTPIQRHPVDSMALSF